MGNNTSSKAMPHQSSKYKSSLSSQRKDHLNAALNHRIEAEVKTLDELFINFHQKIESAKLNIENKYKNHLEIIDKQYQTRIENGLNDRREVLLRQVWNDRDKQLLNYKQYSAANLIKFNVSSKTNPNYIELYFCNRKPPNQDLAYKIKYLNFYDKSKFINEIGARVRNVYNINLLYNTDLDATCILVLNKQLLFFYSSFTNQIQIKDLSLNVYVSRYLEQLLETTNDHVLNEQLRSIEGFFFILFFFTGMGWLITRVLSRSKMTQKYK